MDNENAPNLNLDDTAPLDSHPLSLPPLAISRQSRPIMARIPLNDTSTSTNSSHFITRTQSVQSSRHSSSSSSSSSSSTTTSTHSAASTRTIQPPHDHAPPKYTGSSPSWVRQFWPQGLGLWVNTGGSRSGSHSSSSSGGGDVESGVGSLSSTSTLPPLFEELSREGTPLPAYKSPVGLVGRNRREGQEEDDDEEEEGGIGWRRRVRWWAVVAILCVGAVVCVMVWRVTMSEGGSTGNSGGDTSQNQRRVDEDGTPTVSSSLSATSLRI